MLKGLPVAWLNLTYKPSRLLLSLAGIVFAAVLMFMFTGFENALYDSQIRLIEQLNGQVFLIHSRRSNMIEPVQFPFEVLYQAKTYSNVSSVHPVYLGKAFWRNPDGTTAKAVRLIAFNPEKPIFKFPEIQQYKANLLLPDTVLVDSRARAEIGRRRPGTVTELGDRQVKVIGNFDLGNDFATFNGNLITSEENFLRYQTQRDAKQTPRSLNLVDIGVIFLNPQVSPEQAVADLKDILPQTVSVYTRQGLIAWESYVWKKESNIGFIFGILTFMGFVIGIVLCYQILYSDITDNIKAYATVKAIGYSNGYLSIVVLQQALLLALLGFIPSVIFSYFLYQFAISITGLVFKMTVERTSFIFIMTLLMCVFSGLISAFKVQKCDPADIF